MVNTTHSGSAVAEQLLHRDFYQNRGRRLTDLKESNAVATDGSERFTVAFSISFVLTPLSSSVAAIFSQVFPVLKCFYLSVYFIIVIII